MDILTTEKKIKEIIANALDVESEMISPGAEFIKDLGVDSLDAVEIILTLQDEFGIEIPEEDAKKIVVINDAINYVENRLINRNGK